MSGAERKLATIVFADLVGSTTLVAGRDPEDVRRSLEPFFETARRSFEEHGGRVEKYIGDAVMAVFGVPRAHGDDPDRAVAASLALVDRLAAEPDHLELRIGVEAGEVLASSAGGDLAVTGEPAHAAARLQEAAEPGQVLVGARAARACRAATFGDPREVVAKGFPAPIEARPAIGASDPDSVGAVGPAPQQAPLVRSRRRARVPPARLPAVGPRAQAPVGPDRRGGWRRQDPPSTRAGHRYPLSRSGPAAAHWAQPALRGRDRVLGTGGAASWRGGRSPPRRRPGGAGSTCRATRASRCSARRGHRDHPGGDPRRRRRRQRHRGHSPLVAPSDRCARRRAPGADRRRRPPMGRRGVPRPGRGRRRPARATSAGRLHRRPEIDERRPGLAAKERCERIDPGPLAPTAAEELAAALVAELVPISPGRSRRRGRNPFFTEEIARPIEADGADVARRRRTRSRPRPPPASTHLRHRRSGPPRRRRPRRQVRAEALGGCRGRAADVLVGLERRTLIQDRTAEEAGVSAFHHQSIRDVAYVS